MKQTRLILLVVIEIILLTVIYFLINSDTRGGDIVSFIIGCASSVLLIKIFIKGW